MKKIYNIFSDSRCLKKEIIHNNKRFKIYLLKDSHVKVNFLGQIIVDDYFFKKYNHSEQIAILYHEVYHKRLITSLKQILYLIRYLSLKKAKWQEEFDADKFSAKKFNKTAILSFLKKAKNDYKIGIVTYNYKTHPPIDERIKRIKEMMKDEI